jgi:hypothetical protein
MSLEECWPKAPDSPPRSADAVEAAVEAERTSDLSPGSSLIGQERC